MSEEEIIEIIEKLQCEYKEQENDKKYNDYTVFKAKEYSKGLQGLLDLYNKEKEKNKKLEAEYLIQRDLINPDFLKDWVSNDKLKEFKEFYINEHKNKDITLIPLENLIKNINKLLEE